MITYISLLRGINVSGQKKIKMDALSKMYETLGFKEVQTYIQSGNVVFQYQKLDHKELEVKISDQIQEHFGFEVPVIVLDIVELSHIIENNPFLKDLSKDISHLYITFLSSKTEKHNFEKINQKISNGEGYTLLEKAIYISCPNGYGKTKLTNTFFEKELKVIATTRNMKTTNELLNIAKKVSVTK